MRKEIQSELQFDSLETDVVGGAVCKSNCCCCYKCAEQPHDRDPSSLAKDDDVTTTVGSILRDSENFTASLTKKTLLKTNIFEKGLTLPAVASERGEAATGEPVCDTAVTIPCINNYVTIKELHDIEEEDDQLEEEKIADNSSPFLFSKRKKCNCSEGPLSTLCGVASAVAAASTTTIATTATTTITTSASATSQQQSPQFQQLQKQCDSRKKKRSNLRNRTPINTAVSSENATTCGNSGGQYSSNALSRMQAEQGSIGDLQKYHNRYLRNRRHTLANVR